jgi:hypothetical protein
MTDDKDKPKSKMDLISLPGKALAAIPNAIAKLGGSTPSQADLGTASVYASTGSVAIAGNNTGSIINVNAANITFANEKQIARELPSYLSRVVAKFSEDLSEYNSGPKRSLPPEVDQKLAYNDFPLSHHIISDYLKYLSVLEATYRGVEQRNDDARRLVRRRAAVAYTQQLHVMCVANKIKYYQAHTFARENAIDLVMAVVDVLLADVTVGNFANVMEETAHLAVCLIVADAVIECEVLERPVDVITS